VSGFIASLVGATYSSNKTVEIKIWGSGGAGGNYSGGNGEFGGPGGYATATFNIKGGTTLSIVVGSGGKAGGTSGGNGVPNGGGSRLTDSGFWSGGGGGLCAVFAGSVSYSDVTSASAGISSKALIMAGSGGGASYYIEGGGGGYGGGDSGSAAINRRSGGTAGAGGGGTATAGGTAGAGGGGTAGSFLTGSTNSVGNSVSGVTAGGGGAGWYGGGSGGNDGSGGGGGGGSGMVASVTTSTSLPTDVSSVTGNSFTMQTGTGTTAPNNSDSDYVAGRCVGGVDSTNGGDGLIVIYVNGVKTSYNASPSVQTLTV